MNVTKRIFWDYVHTAARYEEVQQLLSAGFEVLPKKVKPYDLRVDEGYEDPRKPDYIRWELTCSLRVNVAEEIRQIDLSEPYLVSERQWALLKIHIDVLFVQVQPKDLMHIAENFHGLILQRNLGFHGDTYTIQCQAAGIDPSSFPLNVIYCYNLPMLLEREDPYFVQNAFPIPHCVSPERFMFDWAGEESNAEISMVISYMDSPIMGDVFASMQPIFDCQFTRVFGKNRCAESKNGAEICGELEFRQVIQGVCNSRIHVETGINSQHLRFSPLEAAMCGVPVVFFSNSGLAKVLELNGYSEAEICDMGMVESPEHAVAFIDRVFNDFIKLSQMAHNLKQAVSKIFSAQEVQKGISILKDRLHMPQEALIPPSHFHTNPSIEMIWPTLSGEHCELPIRSTKLTELGLKHMPDDQSSGMLLNANHCGLQILGTLLVSLEAFGIYQFGFDYETADDEPAPEGTLSVAVFEWGDNGSELLPTRICASDAEITEIIFADNSNKLLEFRFLWNGITTTEVKAINIKKV